MTRDFASCCHFDVAAEFLGQQPIIFMLYSISWEPCRQLKSYTRRTATTLDDITTSHQQKQRERLSTAARHAALFL